MASAEKATENVMIDKIERDGLGAISPSGKCSITPYSVSMSHAQ